MAAPFEVQNSPFLFMIITVSGNLAANSFAVVQIVEVPVAPQAQHALSQAELAVEDLRFWGEDAAAEAHRAAEIIAREETLSGNPSELVAPDRSIPCI
jgi:hypothetical protein